jgi:polar amino acid transport system permease protein
LSFDLQATWEALHSTFLLGGAFTTIWLAVTSMVGGLILGFALAMGRLYGPPAISALVKMYVWLFRGTPLLVQLIIIYTGLPQIGVSLSVVQSALIGFTLNEAAYLSETIRAGIEAVPKGQTEAARALGMNAPAVVRRVIMPQATRIIIPPLGNSFNLLLKGTSLASVISMSELLRRTEILAQTNFKVLEVYAAAGIYYLAMTTAWGFVQNKLEARFGRSTVGPRASKVLAEQA